MRETWRLIDDDRIRVDAARPGELGIHSAIPGADGDDELPAYVERDFDYSLQLALAGNLPERGSFVVLVGGSSSGKTRSLYQAVYSLVPDWSLFLPSSASDLLDLKNAPPSGTVFWLDELQQYLGSSPPLTAECVRALVRKGNLVVGTLWPDQYAKWTAGTGDAQRLMKSAVPISVPDRLTPDELAKAEKVAGTDGRIRRALDTRDAGLTQALAGGPELVMSWEQAPTPYAKAIIAAAADAHRLGVQSPLPEDMLAEAMFGYLVPKHRTRPVTEWLAEALPYVTRPMHGDVSALSPVDDGRAGTIAGYALADYLAQHLRGVRRTTPVPHRTWIALGARLRRPEDLRRVAAGAVTRLRHDFALPVLALLADEYGDGRAATELADLLVRRNRFDDAFDYLGRHLKAEPHDRLVTRKLYDTQQLWRRVEQVRATADASSPATRTRLVEMLADGGVCDRLRQEAGAGDRMAAERLVEHLVDRGCVGEIADRADRGDEFAAEALADMYLAWGEIDRLQERAEAGDVAAERRLSKAHRHAQRRESAGFEIAELRAAADEGHPEAALQLCTLLFELRDEENIRAELEAGTTGAAERLIALYTAEDRPELIHLRAFGLDADGDPVNPGYDFINLR